MNSNTRLLATLIAAISLQPAALLAVPVEITITGRVVDSFDQNGSVFGLGGTDTGVGQSVVGRFIYDLALAPPADPSMTAQEALYYNAFGNGAGTAFITSSSWSLNGFTYASGGSGPADAWDEEILYLYDGLPAGGAYGTYDNVFISDCEIDVDAAIGCGMQAGPGTIGRSIFGNASWSSTTLDLLAGLTLPTQFAVTGTNLGTGYFELFDSSAYYAWGIYEFDSVSSRLLPIAAPEPGSLGLLALAAIAGLLVRRRR